MMTYLLTLLASLWTAEPRGTGMCSCWLPETAREARDRSAAVFTGVAVSARDDPQPAPGGGWFRRTHVTFRVEAAWKGVDTPEMEIVNNGSSCDYEFKQGKRYMVYAIRHPEAGFLIAGVCSRTHQVASYHDDVDVGVLRAPVRWWHTPSPIP